VHQLDRRRQDVLDTVSIDRVRVPTAHLHELELVVAGKVTDRGYKGPGSGWISELVDELHPVPSMIADESNASSSSS
jgi:hypothetical protein